MNKKENGKLKLQYNPVALKGAKVKTKVQLKKVGCCGGRDTDL